MLSNIPHYIIHTIYSKLQLGIIYKLWDIMIEENDQLFIHFIVIAFLQYKRDLFIGVDSSLILLSFSKIKIDTLKELKEIITRAKQIRLITPFSFRILVQKLEIFKPRSKRLKELYTKFNTDEMITLPILSSELIYIMYNDMIKCPDSQSQKYHNYSIPEGSSCIMSQEEECYYCNLKETLNKQFLVIDLRILRKDEEYFNEGSLLIETLFSRKDLIKKELDIDTLIYNKIGQHKGKAHIILITNDTLYFPRYEQKYYCNKSSFNLFVSTLFGKSQKCEREINEKEVQNLIKDKSKLKKRYKLKEYENIKKVIDYLQKKDYPHVSYVYGGFREVHELAVKYGITLANHNTDKCQWCIKKKSKNEKIDLFYKLYGGGGKAQGQQGSNLCISPSKANSKMSLSPREERKDSIEILNMIKTEDKKDDDDDDDEKDGRIIVNGDIDRYTKPIDFVEVDTMNDYIRNSSYVIFHSLLLKHNFFDYKDKVVIMFTFDTMKVYKMLVEIPLDKTLSAVVNFGMLDLIKINDIKSYTRSNNVFKINYNWIKSKPNEEDVLLKENLTFDLFTDIDGNNFENELEEIISMYKNTKITNNS